MDNLKVNLDNDINYHIAVIKQSLLKIKKLAKDHHEAYLYKDVIINLTNNIGFFFYSCYAV